MKSIPTSAVRLFIVLAAGLSLALAAAASPRDELLRLVPENVHLCAVVQDMRDRAGDQKEGSLLAQFAKAPFAKTKFDSPDFKKLIEIEQRVLKDLQLTPQQLRDEILGDALVFAYRQGPTQKPEDEQGLFLIWARDGKLLATIADRVNELQKTTGELKKLASVAYGDATYQHRVKVKNDATTNEYYLIRGHVLVYSQQESMIQAVIDRDRNQPSVDRERPFWSKMLHQLGLEKALFSFLFSPRNFDAELTQREKAAKGDERAFLLEFRKYWQACDGLGLAADIGANFEISCAVHIRKDALPKAAQQFFAEFGKPSALWSVIPEDALFAMGSRVEFTPLIEMFSSFCDAQRLKEIRDSLEASPKPFSLGVVHKGLGPDWGLWAFAPAPKDKAWLPQMMFAVKVQGNPDGVVAQKAVQDAVQFLATLAQFSNSSIRVESINRNNTEIRCLSSETLFPAGLRPAFAAKDGYLLFSGSPETIQRFSAPGPSASAEEVPLFRISATGWSNYLTAHKGEVAEFAEKTVGLPVKEGAAHIDLLLANLKAFDRFEVAVKTKSNQATLLVRLKGNSIQSK